MGGRVDFFIIVGLGGRVLQSFKSQFSFSVKSNYTQCGIGLNSALYFIIMSSFSLLLMGILKQLKR